VTTQPDPSRDLVDQSAAGLIRRQTRTTTTRVWEWSHRWGPQLGDQHDWSLSRTGTRLRLAQGGKSLDMDEVVAERLLQALIEALRDEEATP